MMKCICIINIIFIWHQEQNKFGHCVTFVLFSGPGEEPPDVCCAWGGGGPEGADQGADRAQLPAGTGEHPVEDAGKPRADGPVPGPGSDRLPTCPSNCCNTRTPQCPHFHPDCPAQLWPFGVTRATQTDWVFFFLCVFPTSCPLQLKASLTPKAGSYVLKTRICTYI